jgi:exo-1,4-beta-D-glucosaminidase
MAHNLLKLDSWLVQHSSKINLTPVELCQPDADVTGFYQAKVPSTVLGTLTENGVYEKPLAGENLRDITKEPFLSSWWYLNHFSWQRESDDENVELAFDGINYRANIWLNGRLIADSETVVGAFRRFIFDVSDDLVTGKNTLAIEVFPPEPGDFSVGFVDWNPAPPDNNMGLFRPVTLKRHGGVTLHHVNVVSTLVGEQHEQASLTIEAMVHNHRECAVEGVLRARFDGCQIKMPLSLRPGEQRQLKWMQERSAQLCIDNPRLWWPRHYGSPELYSLELDFIDDSLAVSDQANIRFGIREVTEYINEQGHRGYKVNGLPVLIKGAGWTDDIFLRDTEQSLKSQINYVKHLNLNCLRLEGVWGKNHTLYDLCDEHGILVMVGWSCHWEHEQYLGKEIDGRFGGVLEESEIDLVATSWCDQVLWLRHHPCIFVWTVASDRVPKPELELRYRQCFSMYDQTRPYLASTGGVGSEQGIVTDAAVISEISGPARVKMLGPYAYTPPIYWYTDTTLGGAYGFNTETCPGNNVPPLASMKKMLDTGKHWPINEAWEFHGGRNVFSSLDRINKAITKRYGAYASLEEYTEKAQILNYELMRPMFEAFQVNQPKATGIIQWMLNAAWPKVGWQLYDHYLRPNGAFYAARKGCEPFHAIYHYGDHAIFVVNEFPDAKTNVTARVQLWSQKSKKIFEKWYPVDIGSQSSVKLDTLPEITAASFVDLRLLSATGEEISHNFYWISAQPDELDYEAEFDDWAFYTPSKAYADFTAFNEMPKARLKRSVSFERNNEYIVAAVKLSNISHQIAFFCVLTLISKDGKEVLPICWHDNYLSLLPGESRVINASFPLSGLNAGEPVLEVNGFNIAP